jgi:hypothetical protein
LKYNPNQTVGGQLIAFGTSELILLATIFGGPVILLLLFLTVRRRMKGSDGRDRQHSGHLVGTG